MKIINIVVLSAVVLALASCTSRGLKIGEQIPEFHPEYDAAKPQIFTQGGDPNKVVYDSLGSKVKKSLGHETKYLNQSVTNVVKGEDGYLYYQIHPDLQRKERIAKEAGGEYTKLSMAENVKALVFYTGYNNADKEKSEVIVEEGDTLYSLSQKIFGDVSRWKELAITNLHLFRVKVGDVLYVREGSERPAVKSNKTVNSAKDKESQND